MLPIHSTPEVKKFLCLDCESRFEEEIYDEIVQEFACLNCKSVNILPFPESAVGQSHGCGSKSCCHRVGKLGEIVDCENCEDNCHR